MRTTGIKGETFLRTGTAEPADLWFCFKDDNLLPPFMQETGQGQS